MNKNNKLFNIISTVIIISIAFNISSCQYFLQDINRIEEKDEVLATEFPIIAGEREVGDTLSAEVKGVFDSSEDFEKLDIIVKKKYELGKYESFQKCYLGAYILADKSVNYDIKLFEEKVKTKHGIYIYNMEIDDEFPSNWVLSCIANLKTPCIVVKPSKNYDIYNTESLKKLSLSLGEYNTNMFVQLYPITEDNPYNEGEYKKFYEIANSLFKENAPKIAIVWTIDSKYPENFTRYYPGYENVDWVGINLFEKMEKDLPEVYDDTLLENFNYFYNIYSMDKPIMLSSFGVSHYSGITHTYEIEKCIARINNMYENVKTKYTRVKAINYINVNENRFEKTENYSVTDENNVLNGYKKIISDKYFTDKIYENSKKNENEKEAKILEQFPTSYEGYYKNGTYYVNVEFLEKILNLVGISQKNISYINNERVLSLDYLKKYGYVNYEVRENKLIITKN